MLFTSIVKWLTLLAWQNRLLISRPLIYLYWIPWWYLCGTIQNTGRDILEFNDILFLINCRSNWLALLAPMRSYFEACVGTKQISQVLVWGHAKSWLPVLCINTLLAHLVGHDNNFNMVENKQSEVDSSNIINDTIGDLDDAQKHQRDKAMEECLNTFSSTIKKAVQKATIPKPR